MRNRQTCSIGDLNLILAVVAFLNMQPFHVIGEMVGGAQINVPWRVFMVRAGRVSGPLIISLINLIEMVAAVEGFMPPYLADLTLGPEATSASFVAIATTITVGTAVVAVATVHLLATTIGLATATSSIVLATATIVMLLATATILLGTTA
jgi:hypothetical protein